MHECAKSYTKIIVQMLKYVMNVRRKSKNYVGMLTFANV